MKRLPGESNEQLKDRRIEAKKLLKWKLKGVLFWDSFRLGTYVRPLRTPNIKGITD